MINKIAHRVSPMYGENSLSFALCPILAPIEQGQDRNPFHHTRSRVAQELASGLECSVNSNVVCWGHVKIAGFRRVMRRLFRDVVCPSAVGKVPVASEHLTEDGVQGLLHSPRSRSAP